MTTWRAVAALSAVALVVGCREDNMRCHRDLDPRACSRMCGQEDSEACLIWGHYDPARQHEAFESGCRFGSAGACNRLSMIEADPARRSAALRRACEGGFTEACDAGAR